MFIQRTRFDFMTFTQHRLIYSDPNSSEHNEEVMSKQKKPGTLD